MVGGTPKGSPRETRGELANSTKRGPGLDLNPGPTRCEVLPERRARYGKKDKPRKTRAFPGSSSFDAPSDKINDAGTRVFKLRNFVLMCFSYHVERKTFLGIAIIISNENKSNSTVDCSRLTQFSTSCLMWLEQSYCTFHVAFPTPTKGSH